MRGRLMGDRRCEVPAQSNDRQNPFPRFARRSNLTGPVSIPLALSSRRSTFFPKTQFFGRILESPLCLAAFDHLLDLLGEQREFGDVHDHRPSAFRFAVPIVR
jgi:hypothetical protein